MGFAPEVAEVAGFGLADFALLFALIGLLCLRFIWVGTFGALFRGLADLFDLRIPTSPWSGAHPLRPIANALRAADNFIFEKIGQGIASTEHTWHRFLLWQAYILIKTGEEIASLSLDTWHGLRAVYAHVAPAKIIRIVQPTVTHTVTKVVTTVVPKPAATKAATDALPHLTARVARLEHELAHVATGAVAIPLPHVGQLEREVGALNRWVKEHRKLLTTAGIVGLIAAATTRLGMGWTRCSNYRNNHKALCAINPSLFESLLADTLLIVGSVSLVKFAAAMVGIMEGTSATVLDGFSELRGVQAETFTGYTGQDKPMTGYSGTRA